MPPARRTPSTSSCRCGCKGCRRCATAAGGCLDCPCRGRRRLARSGMLNRRRPGANRLPRSAGDRAERAGRVALLTGLPRVQRGRFAPGLAGPMQVPRETSRQNPSKSGSRPIPARRAVIPIRRAASTTSLVAGADPGAVGGWRLRPMSFVRSDGCPYRSEAHAGKAPAAPARGVATTAPPSTAPPTAGGAGGRAFSAGSIQRREPGLFHVEPGSADPSASRTWCAGLGPGAGVFASPGGARGWRRGIPARSARPPAERARRARRLRP